MFVGDCTLKADFLVDFVKSENVEGFNHTVLLPRLVSTVVLA